MYRHSILIFLFYLVVSLHSGCTDSQWTEPFPDRLNIAVLDSIGIETGDSCYVLGAIVDAEISPIGSILMLDPQEMALLQDGRIIVRDSKSLCD